ncbi:hypothetical protein ACNQR9_24425 [Mycolicibacterium peregrinum]
MTCTWDTTLLSVVSRTRMSVIGHFAIWRSEDLVGQQFGGYRLGLAV